jgi:hypothetical protein
MFIYYSLKSSLFTAKPFTFAIMKFVAFIMAFLVLVLPVLPCADEGFASDADKAQIEIVKQHSQPEEQEHNDNCSPFCHCTCCAGFSINHFFEASSSPVFFDNKSYTSYLPENIIKVSHSIWQPPRFS